MRISMCFEFELNIFFSAEDMKIVGQKNAQNFRTCSFQRKVELKKSRLEIFFRKKDVRQVFLLQRNNKSNRNVRFFPSIYFVYKILGKFRAK